MQCPGVTPSVSQCEYWARVARDSFIRMVRIYHLCNRCTDHLRSCSKILHPHGDHKYCATDTATLEYGLMQLPATPCKISRRFSAIIISLPPRNFPPPTDHSESQWHHLPRRHPRSFLQVPNLDGSSRRERLANGSNCIGLEDSTQ